MSQDYIQTSVQDQQKSTTQDKTMDGGFPFAFALGWNDSLSFFTGIQIYAFFIDSDHFVNTAILNGSNIGAGTWNVTIQGTLCLGLGVQYGNYNLTNQNIGGFFWLSGAGLFPNFFISGSASIVTGTLSYHHAVGGGLYAPAYFTQYFAGTPGAQFNAPGILGDLVAWWVGKTPAQLPAINFNPAASGLASLPTTPCQ